MVDTFITTILQSTGATSLEVKEVIQDLWSGYGQILRIDLEGGPVNSIVVKHVKTGAAAYHPRGWATDIGHTRKVRSYEVETAWYTTYTEQSRARLPHCLAVDRCDGDMLMVLEDLDAAGYDIRKQSVTWQEVEACLVWLAAFHASYLDVEPIGLWEVGAYWHLDTRPDELARLTDVSLKTAASAIDHKLKRCTYKTLVHGDAKLANFCFSPQGDVAAVDYQYVGGGCGMKDVAYFVGSCLDEADCERLEEDILDTYFTALHTALGERHTALEEEWRSLYHVAWADFHRFLKGWSPGHWKINSYSTRVTKMVIERLK